MRSVAKRKLRPLNAPRPIRVEVDANGQPHVIWRPTEHGVLRIQDLWRIDDEWWREHPISRLYYTLLLDDGSLLVIYHDLLTDAWFEQHG